jgi:hypothetical protein
MSISRRPEDNEHNENQAQYGQTAADDLGCAGVVKHPGNNIWRGD